MANFPETVVRYADRERSIVLRPTQAEELAPFFPLHPTITQFLPESTLQGTLSSPERICQGPIHSEGLSAGIYADGETLIGIGYAFALDKPYPAIGQYILNPDFLRRGYGALTIHGLSRFVTESGGRPVVQATTTESNLPSQRSLSQAGFFETQPKDFVEIVHWGPEREVSLLRAWLLFRPGSSTLPKGHFRDPDAETIASSRQRYAERNQQIIIEHT